MTAKERNEASRSSLQDAIRSIMAAHNQWKFPLSQALALVEQLKELKARIKSELPPAPPRPRAIPSSSDPCPSASIRGSKKHSKPQT